MAGLARLCAGATILSLTVAHVAAADLATPAESIAPPPPIFYCSCWSSWGFQTNAQPTGGGLFGTTNIVVAPVYTLAFEEGYFVKPNIAIALATGLPPIEHFKATGSPFAGTLGTGLQGSTRAGLLILLLQYHFAQFGPIQPYAGIGVAHHEDPTSARSTLPSRLSRSRKTAPKRHKLRRFRLRAG